MKQGFRQSMAWLHTWSGLLFGWLLFVMFACGTSAYFQEEITRWMQPEVARIGNQTSAIEGAVRWLGNNAAGSSDWYITPPGKRSATTAVFWTAPEGVPEGLPTEATLDGSGQPVVARATAGGYFLYRFHYDLHYLPILLARYIVGIAAMFMLVAILSGIVTHKKIFIDFFMLRFGKGQRSWLDAHNATAVLALPFHLMITYTGLVTLATQLMPAPILAAYTGEESFFADALPQGKHPEKAGRPVPLAPIVPMIERAKRDWGQEEVGYVTITYPGDVAATVTITSSPEASMDARGQSMQFNGATGRLRAVAPERSPALKTEAVMIGLHAGRYADMVLRWLYFLSGLAGTAMIATGLVLWTVKRRAKLPDPAQPHLGFRIVERLNIAVVAGFPIGLAGYFLANRLLPLKMVDRPDWEIHTLFLIWGCTFVWALVRPARRGWIELAVVAAAMFALVPVVSGIVTGRSLPLSLLHRDWLFAGFDMTMFALAGVFLLLARKMIGRGAKPA
jgi:uncharacterized iron-regulated membrane protein